MNYKNLLFILFLFCISFSGLAKKVEISDARLIAKNTYFEQANRHDAVPYQSIGISSEYIEKFHNQVVYYIFNINDKGFVIISADDICFPVIAFSFESFYSPSNEAEQFHYWMNLRKQEIAYNVENNVPVTDDITASWQRLNTTDVNKLLNNTNKSIMDVAPLVTTLWDQGFPYNELVPLDATCSSFDGHVTTGCIATAMSQIMYYWRWPINGVGTHCDTHHNYGFLCAGFDTTTYDWNGMVDQPSKENLPIATLMSHCGISVDMYYNQDGACSSGAQTSAVVSALKIILNIPVVARMSRKAVIQLPAGTIFYRAT